MNTIIDKDTVLKHIDQAHEVVCELCEGKRDWVMRIPAEEEHDPDLVIGRALREAQRYIQQQHTQLVQEFVEELKKRVLPLKVEVSQLYLDKPDYGTKIAFLEGQIETLNHLITKYSSLLPNTKETL